MKLNYKRTILVGFAFFLITAFWQAYDATIALTLTNKFGMSQFWSGWVMALDNILAVFLLPLFGSMSDKHKGKSGRRTPFIRFGTLIAAVALVGLSFVDNVQLSNLHKFSQVDDPAALEYIYDTQVDTKLFTPDGKDFVLSETFSKEEFVAINSTENKDDYTNFVVPARQACASAVTKSNPVPLVIFIGVLLIILLAMATFRSPAVALMPDVTIKPLRSKANAVINLMGTAGGILVLVLGIVFGTSAHLMSYTVFYGVLAAIMIGALIIFLATVKEPQWVAQMQEDSIRYGVEETQAEETKRSLSKREKLSLICILLSVALWYIGYNAVTSKYSVYATNVLQKNYNTTMLIAQAAAIVAYLPAGIIASKIGRKKTIVAGVVLLAVAFGSATFIGPSSPTIIMNILFVLAGIAWATINVNSFPMVVEMCSGADVGKYTGFYYTASMAAQIITPVLSGGLMTATGNMKILFPYAAIFVSFAIITMLLTKHGDTKVIAKKGLEVLDAEN